MGKRGWALLIMGVIIGILIGLAMPYIMEIIYALTCKGPDCFP